MNPKKTDKVRVVFDTTAQFEGIPHSGDLLKGPDLLNSLIAILILFCLGQYAVIADIEQMVHQVRVRDFETFMANILCYGINGLRCVANYRLKRCAKNQSNYFMCRTLTVEYAEKEFYLDDLLKSNDSEKYLLTLSKKLSEMLSNCSFRLTK